jgi:hypothetical protein
MATKEQDKNRITLIKAGGYVAGTVYTVTFFVFVWAYLQGVNLFWWVTPVIIVCSAYLGLVWHLKRKNRI